MGGCAVFRDAVAFYWVDERNSDFLAPWNNPGTGLGAFTEMLPLNELKASPGNYGTRHYVLCEASDGQTQVSLVFCKPMLGSVLENFYMLTLSS